MALLGGILARAVTLAVDGLELPEEVCTWPAI
jgi:hypothetical protein